MRPARHLALGYALSLTALFVCVGCGTSDAPKSEGASGGGSAGAPASCTPPGYHVEADASPIELVDALLVDPNGDTVPNLNVQVCGINQCYTGMTNGAGRTAVEVDEPLVLPAFKYGDGYDFAELAAPLGDEAQQDLGQIVAVPLPSYADGATFPASGSVMNGDLTLRIAAGTNIAYDALTYSATAERVFRSAPVPLADSARAFPASFGFELGYGVAPILTTFCPAAALSVKNTLGWDPGTHVEVFVQGLATDEEWAPYGSWAKVADASVSSDGSSIDTTSGGIPILSSIALRRK